MPEEKQDRLLHVYRVAKRLKCSRHYIYRLMEDQDLEAVRIGQKALRVMESSLRGFIEKRKVDPLG